MGNSTSLTGGLPAPPPSAIDGVHMTPPQCRIGQEIDGEWSEITTAAREVDRSVLRITAPDLGSAQRMTSDVHSSTQAGRPRAVVFLDVEFHIADDARTACAEVATMTPPNWESPVRYVGTLSGLAGFLRDIVAVGVADGVTLLPLDDRPPSPITALLDLMRAP